MGHRSAVALACMALAWTLPVRSLAGSQADTAGTADRPADPPSAAEAATTQAVDPKDPLHSPASMVQEFLLAIGESKKTPERMKDAVRCLDLSALKQADPAAAEKQGPILANQLEQIIDALLNVYGKSLDDIPGEPEGDTVLFPTEGRVRLTLAVSADGLWRISARTVAAIPELLETVREKATTQPEAVADVPPGFRSARATMRTFLEAMADGHAAAAAECLDLSNRPPATRAEIGSDLAERLLFVMDRIEVVVYHKIPDQPNAEPFSWYIGEHGRIELARMEAGEFKGRWLFTAATVDSIESLSRSFEDQPRLEALQSVSFTRSPKRWLLEKVPPSWKGEFMSVQLWQWLGMVLLLVLSYVVHRLAFAVFCAVARPFGRSEHIELSETHIASCMRPLGMLVMVGTWWAGLKLLLIPTAILVYVWPALKFVMTTVAVWAAYRLIDLVGDYFDARAKQTVSRLDDVLVPLVRKMAKIVVVAVGVIFILKAIGIQEQTVNKLFAGLGLGGLAFALAAQDSLKNLFGSVTVVLDRPFQVGDWVKIGGSAEGTVEAVGLRSSRIRTFYNSQITVPNSEIMNATVDNMGRRRYRRISCKLGVTYATTPEQLEAFTEGIRELIRRHPYTRKDYYHVYVNEFADSAINILLYCFHETPDWGTELRERHRLFLDIVRVAKRLGIEFAFPTQTVHLHHESSPSGSVSSPPRSVPDDPADAQEFGRAQAAAVVETLGDGSEKPPPVTS